MPASALLVVVIAGVGATVTVVVAYRVSSSLDVAVIVAVCEEVVAAGAVYVAEVDVVFDKVPTPLKVQLTPRAWLSFVTTAVSVAVLAPSTVAAEEATATLSAVEPPELPELLEPPEPPPQPDRPNAAIRGSPTRTRPFRNIRNPREDIFLGATTQTVLLLSPNLLSAW